MLQTAMPTTEAIHLTLTYCADRIADSRTALRRNPADCDAVHDLRVNVRRARSALALFRPHLVDATRQDSNQRLRRLAGLFRESREWDVLKIETLPKACDRLFNDAGLSKFYQDLWTGVVERGQAKAHHKAAKAEANVPLFIFPRDIAVTLSAPILETAPSLLNRQAKQARRRLRTLDTPDERHDARKAIKRLRYSVEFLEAIFPTDKVADYLAGCKRLHNVLGELNDLYTAITLFEQQYIPERAAMQKWIDRRTKRLLNRLAPAVTTFRKTEPFWLVQSLSSKP